MCLGTDDQTVFSVLVIWKLHVNMHKGLGKTKLPYCTHWLALSLAVPRTTWGGGRHLTTLLGGPTPVSQYLP